MFRSKNMKNNQDNWKERLVDLTRKHSKDGDGYFDLVEGYTELEDFISKELKAQEEKHKEEIKDLNKSWEFDMKETQDRL